MKKLKMDDIDKEAMQFMATLGKIYGLSDLQSKAIAILYLEPEEIAMEEIAEKTGYSLASISNTMKMLEAFGMTQRIKKPGTKKVYFYTEKNLAKLSIKKLEAMRDNFLEPTKRILPQLIKKYRNKTKDPKTKKKIKVAESYYSQLLKFESIMDQWIKELEKQSEKIVVKQ